LHDSKINTLGNLELNWRRKLNDISTRFDLKPSKKMTEV
jgi:hypothetical protein